ncbi:hypothetical protein P5673_026959 [Acropora cervicornis]|uniref:Uncharacterized protein n=1 Tax=Acropora cervicornis TaxID=6130 RepID=A0AAD9PZH4_ACRCE|nr:hypothetical protein P5673_026959 [Acropora cervicornis]
MLDSRKHGDSSNVPVDKPDSIIAAISLMTEQLVSSISTLNSSMDESFDEMKESLMFFSTPMRRETENVSNKDGANAHKNQSGSSSSDDNNQQPQENSTKDPEPSKEVNATLASIVSTLKLGQKKAPAVNAQFAGILKEAIRVNLDDDVLSEMKNLYIRPENCEGFEHTQVNHLIWDKLKHNTKSNDLKLQKIQANLLKRIIPIISVIEQLVKVEDNISPEILDIASLIKTATYSVVILGAVNFGINMQRHDNIKPELNADYKHLCSPTVLFTDFLLGDAPDLSKQLKDIAEAAKVSKKISKNSDSRRGGEEAQIGPQDPSTATDKVKNTVIAGRLKEFGPQWHKITSDTEVLDWVQNCHIEFIDDIEPVQLGGHKVSNFKQSELSIIDREIEKLLSKGVLERGSHSDGELISQFF